MHFPPTWAQKQNQSGIRDSEYKGEKVCSGFISSMLDISNSHLITV